MVPTPIPELLRHPSERPDLAAHRRAALALLRAERRAWRAALWRRLAALLPPWLPGHVPPILPGAPLGARAVPSAAVLSLTPRALAAAGAAEADEVRRAA